MTLGVTQAGRIVAVRLKQSTPGTAGAWRLLIDLSVPAWRVSACCHTCTSPDRFRYGFQCSIPGAGGAGEECGAVKLKHRVLNGPSGNIMSPLFEAHRGGATVICCMRGR